MFLDRPAIGNAKSEPKIPNGTRRILKEFSPLVAMHLPFHFQPQPTLGVSPVVVGR